MNLPTLKEYLKDFTVRCAQVDNLEEVLQRVERGECPFPDCGFENNQEFRKMRRFYHRSQDVVKPEIIQLLHEFMLLNKVMEVT